MTQNERIMKVLSAGRTLTVSEAASRYKIKNLRARVAELRADGNRISTTMKRRRNGTTVAVYSR